MEREGLLFLNKLYRDLADSEQVLKSVKKAGLKKSISREDRIEVYLNRLGNMRDSNSFKSLIKSMYYDKYVIKDENIPKSALMGLTKKEIISAQKDSLAKWINYLTNETTKYPMWAKYWAFQGMLRIGEYDERNASYSKRTKNTVAPFIDVNPGIIAQCIEDIKKFINKENIDDEEVLKLVNTGSFSKLYTMYFGRFKRNIVISDDDNDGLWVKYNRGSREDAVKLAKSLQGYGTGWCTASEMTATHQLCGGGGYNSGDFYVYYTKDKDGNYKVPRIAIRLEFWSDGFRIVEIRGVEESQNLEEGLEEILKNKLMEIDNRNVDRFLKLIDNVKKLSKINYKNGQKIPLTEDEIIFIYEAKERIETFGLEADPRIKRIINSRDLQKDYDSLKTDELKVLFLSNWRIADIVVSDKDVAMKAVQYNGKNLRHIDKSLDNYEEIALEAVKQDGTVLKHISKSLSNYDNIVMEAAKQTALAFEFIDKNIENFQEIAIASARANGHGLKYVDPNVDNYEEIAMDAVKKKCWAFEFVDKSVSNYKDILVEAVIVGQRIAQDLDSDIPNYKELALAAVNANFQALRWLKCPNVIYSEIVFEIVLKNPFALQYVYPSFDGYTKIALELVKMDGLAIQYVYEFADDYKEIAITALRQNVFAIEYVAKSSRDYNEILEEALKMDSDILFKIERKKIKTK